MKENTQSIGFLGTLGLSIKHVIFRVSKFVLFRCFLFKLSPFRVNFACHRENVRLTQLDFPELNKYQITAAATFQTI